MTRNHAPTATDAQTADDESRIETLAAANQLTGKTVTHDRDDLTGTVTSYVPDAQIARIDWNTGTRGEVRYADLTLVDEEGAL